MKTSEKMKNPVYSSANSRIYIYSYSFFSYFEWLSPFSDMIFTKRKKKLLVNKFNAKLIIKILILYAISDNLNW